MTDNKMYTAANVKGLPNNKFNEALRALKLLATNSKEAAKTCVTSIWLKQEPITRIASIGNSQAGGILVIEHDMIKTLTCFTSLTSNRCAEYHGVQATNNLVAHQLAMVKKTKIGGSIVAPIYKDKAKDLGLRYNKRDASREYADTKMRWPEGRMIADAFSNYKTRKVVLGLIPVAILIPYQCNKIPKRTIKEALNFFECNIDQKRSYMPIWRAWTLCNANNYKSWIKPGSGADQCGIPAVKFGASEIYSNFDKKYEMSTLQCDVIMANQTTEYGTAILENVYQAQTKSLAIKFTEKQGLAQTYFNKWDTSTYINIPQTQPTTKKLKSNINKKLTGDSVENQNYTTMRILLTTGDKNF